MYILLIHIFKNFCSYTFTKGCIATSVKDTCDFFINGSTAEDCVFRASKWVFTRMF